MKNESDMPPQLDQKLAARSVTYAALAIAFSHPAQNADELPAERGSAVSADVNEFLRPFAGPLRAVFSATTEQLEAAYMKLFGPFCAVHPYESELRGLKDFRKAQLMADVMGFYHAFGVEPNLERPDHVAVEFEFMHYLAFKEQHALQTGDLEKASVCRDAQVKFFRGHIATWADEFIQLAREAARRDGLALHLDVVDLLGEFMRFESEELL